MIAAITLFSPFNYTTRHSPFVNAWATPHKAYVISLGLVISSHLSVLLSAPHYPVPLYAAVEDLQRGVACGDQGSTKRIATMQKFD
ncbi:hypothetical protein E2C01_102080 [Portunus trituberculatus]|uniref:Uncharacterized protein n=1 Tax=Portunus trituberculatus TaxID=210409 RepID=A0A5B7KHH7_PORTR|nr:hypothetical protein [Portunus trituberculatus]